ncbi:MAG: hypothetical protein LBT86_09855 [Deltaproteobacteria bacterium]|jgi:predicted Mrr-cat superfamily restriction endonuclease|nr:hypothetical protein [Deltaproteobacteria bacterium]
MIKQLWVVRPEPNYINRLTNFLELGIVAIGWPRVGDLSQAQGKRQLSHLLCQAYEHYLDSQKEDLAIAVGVLDRFVNQIKPGDYAIIPQDGVVFVSEVTGDYTFHPEFSHDGPEGGYPHWRSARFLTGKEPFAPIRALPLGARRAIECHLSVFSIHAAAPSLWKFIKNNF